MRNYTQLVHSNPVHSDFFVVNWCIGNTCNFTCSYCPEGLHDGSVPFVDLETACRFSDQVIEHYRLLNPNKMFYFEFTGGEVSLCPWFLELAAHIKGRGGHVGMISNGSRAMPFWQRAVEHLDHVCLSYHPEGAKPEHFFAVTSFLSERLRVHVNIMMPPERFEECWGFAERMAEVPNISMAIQPLIVNFDRVLYDYTEDQRLRIEKQHQLVVSKIKHTRKFESYRGSMTKVMQDKRKTAAPQVLIAANENSWQGWLCSAGTEQIVVNMNGGIFRGWCLEGGKIGNIRNGKIAFPQNEVRCAKNFCHCNFDIMCTKRAEVESRPHPW